MSKYSVAKESIAAAIEAGKGESLEPADVLEALIVSSVEEMKSHKDRAYIKGFLQYELDSLGSGGTYEIQRR